MEKKIQFLYSAISDGQELIRFIDNKTAYVVTILAAYVAYTFSFMDNLWEFAFHYTGGVWWFFLALILLLILCIIVTVRIIKPTTNPVENLNLDGHEIPRLKFYLPLNDYCNDPLYAFYNSNKFKLKESYTDFLEKIEISNDADIAKALALELFKVSYIRNVKNSRFNTLLVLLGSTTLILVIFLIFYFIETDQIRTHCSPK